MHPYLGPLRVRCIDFEASEDKDQGQIANFELTFVEASEQPGPSSFINTALSVLEQVESVVAEAQSAFTIGIALVGTPVALLSGYIDNYLPEVEANRHAVRITGRSKTEYIVDCTPDIRGGQFAGYKLDAIARAIASLFKIDVVVQTDVGEPFPDATIEQHETGFAFLERLARLRSVLMSDDEQGRLVLTRAGNDRAHDALLQGPGGNVQWASAVISGGRRFSHYKVKAQQTVHGTKPPVSIWCDAEPAGFRTGKRARRRVNVRTSALTPRAALRLPPAPRPAVAPAPPHRNRRSDRRTAGSSSAPPSAAGTRRRARSPSDPSVRTRAVA